jgi:acetolactate synthase I/II/III large subunit
MELATTVQHRIPLVAILFNDNAYGNVTRIQETCFGGRTIASDLHNPDLMKLADAYGVEGRRASSPEDLNDVMKRRDPVLIEVPVGPMPPVSLKSRAQPDRPPPVTP